MCKISAGHVDNRIQMWYHIHVSKYLLTEAGMEFTRRQKEIVDVAMEIVSKDGLDGLTTKAIAGALGLSEAALYRHFDGKTDILAGVIRFFEQETRKLLDEVRADQSLSPIQKVYQTLRRRVLQFVETPALVLLIFSEEIFQNTPVLSDQVYEVMKLNRRFFAEFFAESQNRAEIRGDLAMDELFSLIQGTYRFVVLSWKLSGFSYDLLPEFERNWKMVQKLLKIDPQGGQNAL